MTNASSRAISFFILFPPFLLSGFTCIISISENIVQFYVTSLRFFGHIVDLLAGANKAHRNFAQKQNAARQLWRHSLLYNYFMNHLFFNWDFTTSIATSFYQISYIFHSSHWLSMLFRSSSLISSVDLLSSSCLLR